MEDIRYTIVKQTDSARILELYKAAGWWGDTGKQDDIKIVNGIVSQSFCFVIALLEGEIIGMGRAISDKVSDAYIQDVTVLKEYRGRGYGKGIVRHIVAYLKAQKIGWIGLISEPGYERFYNGLGFKQMQDYTPFLLGE